MALTSPRIVITGDRDTGKSSFITTICGVSVPGTTRGVIEWNLSVGPWAAQVSTHRKGPVTVEHTQNGMPVHEQASDVKTLAHAIAQALAELKVDFDIFRDSRRNEVNGIMPGTSNYNPYTVYVSLRTQDVPFDMTIIDLPGVTSCGDDVEYVNAIVLSHLKPERNIIVLAMPVSSYETSHAAFNLVKQADPRLCRTIALLTKPDRVEGGEDRWLSILEGKEIRPYPSFCTYGYQFTPHDPHQAHLRELKYFNNTNPWSTTKNRHVFGANAVIWAAKRIFDESSHRLTGSSPHRQGLSELADKAYKASVVIIWVSFWAILFSWFSV